MLLYSWDLRMRNECRVRVYIYVDTISLNTLLVLKFAYIFTCKPCCIHIYAFA